MQPKAINATPFANLAQAENWTNVTGVDYDDVDWLARLVFYCIFGIVIMVALDNIFIAILSKWYHYYNDSATSLFVQRRARWALDYSLLKSLLTRLFGRMDGEDRDKYLWSCTPFIERP